MAKGHFNNEQMLRNLSHSFINLLGFNSSRKIFIIFSDDWGGIRVGSWEARKKLIQAGINMDGNRFDRFDSLESNADLEALFDVLLKHKDFQGNHPVITAACNIANPDFSRIRDAGFKNYYYEPFTESLKRYPNHDRVFGLYRKGIELKIFKPELHGREHLQVKWWLENLQSKNEIVRKAFEHEYWHLSTKYLNNSMHRSLGAAYDITSLSEVKGQEEIVADGARLFNSLFGYQSLVFIPPAQKYNKVLEPTIRDSGFKMVDVPRLRKMPMGYGKYETRLHYLGQKSRFNLRYITRNTVFEPNLHENSDYVNECMAGIENAFRFRKPAIISNHRAAFMGGLDLRNRDKGIKALDNLIKESLRVWPDIEFMSAAEFNELLFANESGQD